MTMSTESIRTEKAKALILMCKSILRMEEMQVFISKEATPEMHVMAQRIVLTRKETVKICAENIKLADRLLAMRVKAGR